jgi:poly(3-hydroxybutyrate) depolymerase
MGTGGTTIDPSGTGGAGRDAGRDGLPGNGGAGTGGRQGTGGVAVDGGTTSAGGGGGASAGCGSANTTSPCSKSGTTCSLDVSGTARTYYVQLPASYSSSKQYPVIFQFHPWGGSAEGALTMYQLNSKIPDAIYVTPQGVQAGTGGPGWANTNGQDIAFTKAMLADVQGKYCVDNARIFSTGFSYGGMMSFAVGCEMSDVFRAIAPMSGSLYSDLNCKGTGHAIAMWGSHGLNDTFVPIADGRSALAKILQQNHCGTTTTPIDPSPCVSYQGCDAGYPVTWCEWDGPHGIPSFGSSAIAAFLKSF